MLWSFTHLLTLDQPDSSVEPFFNSMVRQLGIPDIFSLQMCGAGLSASSTADPAGGSLVSSQLEQPREEFKITYQIRFAQRQRGNLSLTVTFYIMCDLCL